MNYFILNMKWQNSRRKRRGKEKEKKKKKKYVDKVVVDSQLPQINQLTRLIKTTK